VSRIHISTRRPSPQYSRRWRRRHSDARAAEQAEHRQAGRLVLEVLQRNVDVPIAAMICGRWLRGNGAGMRSETPMPPGRGEVSENTFCQISVWPSGSMPAITSAKARTGSQICFCGPPAISPKPTRC
jgi:hypothetical protein